MFWGILFLINVWSTLLFQLVAAICRDDTIATGIGCLNRWMFDDRPCRIPLIDVHLNKNINFF